MQDSEAWREKVARIIDPWAHTSGAQAIALERADRILAALSPAPEGWRVVPVEPTAEMLHAATMQVPTWDDEASRRKWAAMLSASPLPVGGGEPSIPQGESTAAGESVWLIEDVWTTGPGTPLYVHRDYTLKAWTDELAKNHQRSIRGRADFVHTAPLWTNDPNAAMRFASRDAANEWLVFQPYWLNNEQYQAREHMFPPPPAAGQDLSEAVLDGSTPQNITEPD